MIVMGAARAKAPSRYCGNVTSPMRQNNGAMKVAKKSPKKESHKESNQDEIPMPNKRNVLSMASPTTNMTADATTSENMKTDHRKGCISGGLFSRNTGALMLTSQTPPNWVQPQFLQGSGL